MEADTFIRTTKQGRSTGVWVEALEFRESEGGAEKEMNANQERFMAEVALSWLLNVTRKDGGKFIFISGRAGICEAPNFEKCRSFPE